MLVLPTLPGPPPLWSELSELDGQLRRLGRMTRLCAPVNSSGLVAATIPWTADSSGRPVGVQLVTATESALFDAITALTDDRAAAP